MSPAVMTLSDLSYQLGIIGLIEYQERLEIYRWLKDNSNSVADPRNAPGKIMHLLKKREWIMGMTGMEVTEWKIHS